MLKYYILFSNLKTGNFDRQRRAQCFDKQSH